VRGDLPPGAARVDEPVQVIEHHQVVAEVGRLRAQLKELSGFARHVCNLLSRLFTYKSYQRFAADRPSAT
jgi:hypothetical protein